MLFGKNDSVVIDVEEMHCNHCTAKVEKLLLSLAGVKKAKADLDGKCCEVEFNGKKVSVEKMCELLTKEGFPAKTR